LDLVRSDLTEQIIGAAIEVHRALGLGLLESEYEACLCQELTLRGIDLVAMMKIGIVRRAL
jgi:GxxExxY protein